MDKVSGQKSAYAYLYPQIVPNDHFMFSVGDGHEIYVEEVGNPNGVPVVVLHGGPGGGCSPFMRRFFDPSVYRVILFDQRGCGRSRPTASVENNTTWHLVEDIERLRQHFGYDDWVVFGGSWGATLGVAYAETHPDRVRHLVLRGVFLGTQEELDWFYGGGAAKFWPDLWAEFVSVLPVSERDDAIAAYNRRLFSGDIGQEERFGRHWAIWENALAAIGSNGKAGEPPLSYARTFARLENHYFANGCFFEEDGQLLSNADRLATVPGTIVQGRFDMICPPLTAYRLKEAWPAAQLHMIGQAGHALSEPSITQALVQVMDALARAMR
ncbi:prolyl aminopeptidase [Celeribacter sp.]|uniref:prolyl aminopeptidase n=1 Tax=Celeribacter sp. TaxID=1890673 RepID=UPI003A91E59E